MLNKGEIYIEARRMFEVGKKKEEVIDFMTKKRNSKLKRLYCEQTFKDKMTGYYDSIASGYDELHEAEQLKKLELIQKAMSQYPELKDFIMRKYRLLDVGCGSGISTRFFNVKERQGVDPSKELLKIAIRKDPDGKYLLSKAEDIKFLDKEFDVIISLTAMQNFEDVGRALKKIKKSGKRFILSFLKKSDKKNLIEKNILENFKVIKTLEEEKDMIYFCGQICFCG